MTRSRGPTPYSAFWILLGIALASFLVVWGMRIGSSLSVERESVPTPVPTATELPLVATVYSNIGPPNPTTLCAELSPVPKEVTVESTTGVVVATIQCRQ